MDAIFYEYVLGIFSVQGIRLREICFMNLRFCEVIKYFSRFFWLLGLIFNTVDAADNCSWSQRTLHVVSSCPITTEEKLMAEKIKKCEGLAGLQDCSESSLFKYHCVLNEAGDKFLEVCAPEVKIFQGQCAIFNTTNGRIEPQLNRTCYKGGRNLCPLQYMSSESYQFPICYGFFDNFTTNEKVTERINTYDCLEEIAWYRRAFFSFVAMTAFYIIITLPCLFCHNRSRLCLMKCRICLGCSGYGFCKNKEKNTDRRGNMFLPKRKGYEASTSESIKIDNCHNLVPERIPLPIKRNLTMEMVTSDEIVKECAPRKEKETMFPKRTLHPFPKQTSSFCITNICSINHISHISDTKIWLSNRKHIMEINRNGRILNNFDIDDAPGSASHTIDRDGDLLFFMDDTVLRAHSNGKITTFLKQTGKVLSIYYSRITDEIILGTYEMLGNKVNSKLSRYNKKGNLIYVTEFYKGKRLYVLPMFITENINGDICTSDSGTLMVKGVDKFGNLIFNYDGKQTQTEFYPTGICNDAFGHVLVCNRHHTNPSIHVLDLQGIFLSVILTAKDGIKDPYGLCVSDDGCLYLGQYDCNTLLVYRYLDED